MELVEVAWIVTWELAIGLVVPNEDGVEVPLTALASWAKATEVILCLGDRVSKVILSDEASTWR